MIYTSFDRHLVTDDRVQTAPGYQAKWQTIPILKPKDGLPVTIVGIIDPLRQRSSDLIT